MTEHNPRTSIQNQLMGFVIVTLLLLAAALQTISAIEQRNDLIAANRDRSLAIITSVNNTVDAVRPLAASLEDMGELSVRLQELVEQNDHIDFITITDERGKVVFHSEAHYQGAVIPELADTDQRNTKRRYVSDYDNVYLTSMPIDATEDVSGYQIIVAVPAEVIETNLFRSVVSSVLITMVLVLISGIFLVRVLQTSVFRPVWGISKGARMIERGELSWRVNFQRNNELGDLAYSFNSMAERLEDMVDTLEDRVDARTRDLEVAWDVSQQIATELDIELLLQQVVGLTLTEFGLCGAFVYLYDKGAEALVYAAGALEGGADVLQGTRTIRFDAPNNIVAMAARQQTSIVVSNLDVEQAYEQRAGLQQAKSEYVIPLVIGSKLLGVFDVVAAEPDHFKADEVRVLSTLAAQVTITVRNAQLFAEVQSARVVAEEASRMKSKFLANMSHELRTPLNAILNYTEFVAEQTLGPINDEQSDALYRVIDSGEHLLSLINDLLDMSKIEVGMMELFIEDVNLNRLLDKVVATAQSLLKDKTEVNLITNVEQDLPLIKADRRRVRQILLNLVANAVKFTDEGQITISAESGDGFVRLGIIDTGLGIAEDEHALIFQDFRQTYAGLAARSGTGLGLPITKALVEAHHGTVEVDSILGVGSSFYVVLPVRSPEVAPYDWVG